ncbi:MAG: hypothetical protein RR307_02660 [Clostridia bacterium]
MIYQIHMTRLDKNIIAHQAQTLTSFHSNKYYSTLFRLKKNGGIKE